MLKQLHYVNMRCEKIKQERLDHDIVINGVVKVKNENLIDIANNVIDIFKTCFVENSSQDSVSY